ncbi:MAG: transglycosylase SLT domain-containing protein [Desulfovibrio sp.]
MSLFLIVVLVIITLANYRKSPFQPPREIRIAVPRQERIFTSLSPYGKGFERDLAMLFAKSADVKPLWIPVDTLRAGYKLLQQGKVDLFIGTGFTPSRDPKKSSIVAGPIYDYSQPLLMHHVRRYSLRNPEDMCSSEVFMQPNTTLRDAFHETFVEMECPPKLFTTSSVALRPILERFNSSKAVRFFVLDSNAVQPWEPFFPQLRPVRNLDGALPYRWFWGEDSWFNGPLNSFWKKTNQSTILPNLQEKYFGFFNTTTDYHELFLLRQAVRQANSKYKDTILYHSHKRGLDPLLVMAVIFQESRFDASARSRTGVRGLMQLTQATAARYGVTNRHDPKQSIKGGVAYLSYLWKKMKDARLTPWNHMAYTLAAYNQGPGHIYDAMTLAEELGKNPYEWADLKQVLPLLSKKKYYSKTKHGKSRGWEAVTYVDNIRYYYYTLYGSGILLRSGFHTRELEDLTPFLTDLTG